MARPSARTLVIAAAVAIGAGTGGVIAVLVTSGSDKTTTVVAAPPSSTATTASLPPSTAGPTSTVTTTVSIPATLVAPSPSVVPRPENRSPEAVARSFITAYLSWNWSDQPSPMAAVRQRLRPWVTDRFDAGLAQSSSAAAATAARVAAHEVDVPKIASLDQITPAGADTTYLSLVTVDITMDGSPPSKRSVYVQAKLLNIGGNWYVDELVR